MAKKIDLAEGLTHFKAKENASIAITEATSTASAPHKAGEYFYYKGDLVIATADIAQGGTITLNTNCKKQPLADSVCELKTALTLKADKGCGKNLFNVNRVEGTLIGYLATNLRNFKETECYLGLSADGYYDPSKVVSFSLSNNSVITQTKAGYGIGFPVRCEGGATYTFSFAYDLAVADVYSRVGYYDSTGRYIDYQAVPNGKTITTPATAYWMCLCIGTNNSATQAVTFTNIQIEKGSIATAYAAYELLDPIPEYVGYQYSGDVLTVDENGKVNPTNLTIPRYKLNDAVNIGDLIQYQNVQLVENKYVYGINNSKVSIASNNSYNYAVVDIVPNKVYRFPSVSWWAVTDINDTVVLGCGGNGTFTDNVDTTGYATAAKLYVSISKASSKVYIIDNDNGNTDFAWILQGLVATPNNNVFAIPNFKYITNKAWNLYFNGGWLRNAEYKRTSYGLNQYDDHFSFRSTSAGIVNNNIRLYDNNFDSIGVNTLTMTYAAPNYRDLTALFIGDSTINNGGLTAKVLEAFSANDVTCTLLGTTGSGDNKREGRSGWTAADYCGLTERGSTPANNPFYNPSTQTFDFSYYMTQQSYSAPDFVFIQLGINDMFGVSMSGFETGYNTFKANLLTIIESIHSYNADIKIVVNLITMPNGNISAFNTAFGCNYYNFERRYVDIKTNSRLITELPNYVIRNPHNLILDPMTNITDDVHPTADGYNILGEFDADIMFAN